MANEKISQLTALTLPPTGSELTVLAYNSNNYSIPLSAFDLIGVAQTITATKTIAPPANSLNQGLVINQSVAGTASIANWNALNITADTVPGSFLCDWNLTHSWGGASTRGSRVGFFSWLIQTSANSGSGTTAATAVCGISQTNSGDGGTGTTGTTAKGTYFGGNFVARNSATDIYEIVGAEFDLESASGSSAYYSFGASLVNYESVQGSVDAGLVLYSGGQIPASGSGGPWGAGVGFHNGILFAELGNNGLAPIDSSGAVLSTHLESLSTISAAKGIDLTGFTFSGNAYASTGFSVSGTGKTLTLGAGTGTVEMIINGASNSGSGGAVIAFQNGSSGIGGMGNESAQFGGSYSNVLVVSGYYGLSLYTNNTQAIAIDTSQNAVFANAVLSTGAGGVGYKTGSGGTVTQSTSKSTGVTLNTVTGQITMNNASLASATIVSFTLTNSTIAATDMVMIQHMSGGTVGSYTVTAGAAAGSATVYVRNNTSGSLSEALVLQYVVFKAATS